MCFSFNFSPGCSGLVVSSRLTGKICLQNDLQCIARDWDVKLHTSHSLPIELSTPFTLSCGLEYSHIITHGIVYATHVY